MFKPTPLTRELFARTLKVLALRVFAISAILVLGALALSVIRPANAVAVTSNTINFQARLENADGSIAPDGNYNVEFKLYKALTPIGVPDQGACTDNGGTADPDCLWVETRSGANTVKVANGYLTVNLGSVTPFPTTIDWSQQLYLTMNIGGTSATPSWDGEMNPRLQLTAVPYAFDAQQLGGVDASKYARQDASNTFTGATNTFDLPTSGIAVLQNATTTAGLLSLDPEATSNLALQVKSGASTELSIDGNGNVVSQGNGTFVTVNGTTGINTGVGTGTQRIDASGNLLNIGNISGSGTLQLSGTTGNSYIMSALGVGTTSPQAGSALTIANSSWISGVAAGGGYVNMFQLNSNNEIQVGAALNVDGGVVLPTDAGQITFSDLPIDSSAALNTPESYTMRVGSTNALTVYGESNGAGGVQNVRTSIGSSITPQYTLDVNGTAGTLFGVDTANNRVLFGNSTTNAKLVLNSNGGSVINILAPSSAAGYTITLPAAAPTTSQCLQTSGSDATLLAWSVCGVSSLNTFSGAVTLQGTTDEIAVNNNAGTITLSTPQAINTTSNVTFANGTFNNVTVASGGYILLNGSGTRPASPTEGMLYYDSTTKSLLVYANGKWQADRSTAVIVAASNSSQADKDAADYVATGSGDQAKINSAIGSLPAGGGTVYLAEGTYVISGSISLPSNVTLTGSGAASIIKLDSTTASTIKAIVNSDATNGNDHITISNLRLDGVYGTGNRFSDYGIYLTKVGPTAGSSAGAQITGLSIENFGNSGVYLTASNDDVVRGNTFLNNGVDSATASIYFDNSSTDGVIANNWVDASGGDGVRLQNGASSNMVSGNTIVNALEYGIKAATTNNTITGNTLTDTTGKQYGIYIDTAGEDNSITGNTISGGVSGIVALGSDSAISGNTVSGTSSHGIDVESSNDTISGNKIQNAGGTGAGSGIYLMSASGNNITGNSITDTAGTGYAINISDAASSSNYLSNNVYSGTGATTIHDAATGTIYANQQDSSGNLINKSQGGGFTVGASSATASLTLQGGFVTSALPEVASVTITPNTTGSTTYYYTIMASDGLNETAGTTQSIANGAATPNNTITWAPVPGAVSYRVMRNIGPGTNGTLAIVSGNITSYTDNNAAGDGVIYSNYNATGGAKIAGLLQGQSGETINGGIIRLNADSIYTTNINTGTSTGAVNIGNGAAGAISLQSGDAISIGTSSATSIGIGKTGVTTTNNGALTVKQLLTGQLGATLSGAAISLNDNSNFNTTINTGTSTGAVSIGNGSASNISLQSGGTIDLTAAGGINLNNNVTVANDNTLTA